MGENETRRRHQGFNVVLLCWSVFVVWTSLVVHVTSLMKQIYVLLVLNRTDTCLFHRSHSTRFLKQLRRLEHLKIIHVIFSLKEKVLHVFPGCGAADNEELQFSHDDLHPEGHKTTEVPH